MSEPDGRDAAKPPAGHRDTELAGVVRGGAAADHSLDDVAPNSEVQAEARIGSVLAGRYRIDALLGTGGMGAVYRAEHVHMRKAVALKVLHREMTYLPEVVARFEREAVAAARIEHPHVAAGTDFGRLDDGSFYLVLEYIEGRSLRDLLKQEAPLDETRALGIAWQICEGLAAAHAAGVVHRDLKPENVMLVDREEQRDFVKVLDFGIAKIVAEDSGDQPALTQLGTVFGTPEYMSPEQAAGNAVDARADLYTLGLMLYEMVGGTTPFAADDLVVVLTRQLTEPPPPLPARVNPQIAALVYALLEKDPDRRVQTAAELAQRFEALLGARGAFSPSPASVAALSGGYSPPPVSVAAPSSGYSPSPASVGLPPASAAARSVAQARTTPSALLEQVIEQAKKTVEVGGQPVPIGALWAMGAFGVIGALFIVVVIVGAIHGRSSKTAPVESAAPAAVAPGVQSLMVRAETGDREAIAQLEALPVADRTARVYRAIGRGHAVLGAYDKCIAAYANAVKLDPGIADDAPMAKDVRRAVDSDSSSASALELASRMGSAGADILFDVTRSPTKALAQKAKKLLDDPAVASKASPALKVYLDLKSAQGCAAYKRILPDAVEHADDRSSRELLNLTATRGCGFLGLGDCWSCLRGDGNLKKAIDQARGTKAPEL